jgi:hypothetical protein
MCQQKYVNKNGQKKYVPWTFFDDGEWRSMEPQQKLPFWKPKQNYKTHKIMIHEGAKAASFVDNLINNPLYKDQKEKHPFTEFLSDYEHWGMIGGALAPHRTDYSELYKMSPLEVIYVCDNDEPGHSALQEVSRCYKRSLKGICFDQKWPPSWDMADKIPEKFFDKKANILV